jgi:hypothetical protein
MMGDISPKANTQKTGTGQVQVFQTAPTLNSPIFVTPALGTPASGVLTNCTGIVEAGFSFTDITTANSSTSQHGLLRKLDNTATHYLDGTGAWSTPAGTAYSADESTLHLSGTTFSIISTYVGQSSIVTVGTLTGGATGAGFTIALTTSTVTGTLGLARGGTNADLSATGGPHFYLKQLSTGAAVTVGAILSGDLPIFVASGASHAGGGVPDPGATAYTNTQRVLTDQSTWAIAKGQIVGFKYTATDESTTSTTYTDLATADSVTFSLDATQDVLVLYHSNTYVSAGAPTEFVYSQVYLDGTAQTSPVSAVFLAPTANALGLPQMIVYKIAAVGSGSHTIDIKHHCDSSNASHWRWRSLTCFILG